MGLLDKNFFYIVSEEHAVAVLEYFVDNATGSTGDTNELCDNFRTLGLSELEIAAFGLPHKATAPLTPAAKAPYALPSITVVMGANSGVFVLDETMCYKLYSLYYAFSKSKACSTSPDDDSDDGVCITNVFNTLRWMSPTAREGFINSYNLPNKLVLMIELLGMVRHHTTPLPTGVGSCIMLVCKAIELDVNSYNSFFSPSFVPFPLGKL